MGNEFEAHYPNINMGLKENNEDLYDLSIIHLYLGELENGYVIDTIYETSNKDLIVSYKKYEKDSIKAYVDKVNKLIDEYNNKYNKNINHVEITFK